MSGRAPGLPSLPQPPGWTTEAVAEFAAWCHAVGWPPEQADRWLRWAGSQGLGPQALAVHLQSMAAQAQAHVPQPAAPLVTYRPPHPERVPPAPVPVPASAPAPAPAAGAAPKRRSRPSLPWVAAGCVVLLVGVVALVGAGISWFRGTAGAGVEAASHFENVYTEVDPTEVFTFEAASQGAGLSDAVKVWLDPELSMPAPDADVTSSRGEITVQPQATRVDAATEDGDTLRVNSGGKWGLSSRYYIAVYRDLVTDEELSTPAVTMFTVAGGLSAPSTQFHVDETGAGQFSWSVVEGADEYVVVSVDRAAVDGATRPPRVAVLGRTSRTVWSTADVDREPGPSQNDAYAAFDYVGSDDDLHDLSSVGVSGERSTRMFGVIAVSATEQSSIALFTADVASLLPVKIAENALDQMYPQVPSVDALSGTVPVTMADGATVLRAVSYDPAKILPTTEGFRVAYEVEDSQLSGWARFAAADEATAAAGVDSANDRARAATAQVGAASAFTYSTEALMDVEPSTREPDVDFPIYATNPLVRYLAANIVAGERAISLADWLPEGAIVTTTGIDVYDALNEALEQNPYAVGTWNVSYDDADRILYVASDSYPDPAERKAVQEQLHAAAAQGAGAVAGMPAAQQVAEINAWLEQRGTYDYQALESEKPVTKPRAWSAEGILLDGTGVCASYAKAFQAVALEAGLEAVYVTGVARQSGIGHAWNKVEVDGVWMNVDVTWNDDSEDLWLMTSDADLSVDHVEGTDWVVEGAAAGFAAP